jgi:uncharacterized surface protein with fasciclin (FAS1) repeats
MTRTTLISALAATALATSAFAASHSAGNPMVGGAEMFPEKTIAENASAAGNLTTLVAAVKAAGLVDTLASEGPFTVFAPTDDAFGKISSDSLNALLEPEAKDQLTQILTCHVVDGTVMSDALTQMIADGEGQAEVPTLGGCTLTAAVDGDKVTLTDENGRVSTVTMVDVAQSNGVVHVIDTVILPQQ